MQSELYDSCSRILALVLAALRWSGSELRADPALFEALERVLKPFIGMQHMTEHIEQDALQALLLFGSMGVATAKEHWQFMTQLVRKLGADARNSRARQHAEVALSALGDCVRLHAQDSLDDLELLDAVRAVAVVPRGARALVPEAFCGMLLHAGSALLGAHLRSPVVELQWALAWVLVEAFAQPSTEEEHVADELTPRTRLRVLNFFATLPRVLGDHGSALLVISVEAVAASGLWRRAVLLPPKEGGRTRWTHDFSWPRLFRFVTKVVDTAQLRLRLWRCALQLCVANPELASSAEVPLALFSMPPEDASPRIPALLDAAIALGASRADLDRLRAKLRVEPSARSDERFGLVPRAEAEEAERAFHEKLGELQLDVAAWVPPLTDAPKVAAPHVRMRASMAQAAAKRLHPSREDVAPTQAIVPTSAVLPVEGGSAGASGDSPSMRCQRIDWDQKASSPEAKPKSEQEAKDTGRPPEAANRSKKAEGAAELVAPAADSPPTQRQRVDWDQKTSSLETETLAKKGVALAPEAGRANKRPKKAEAAAKPAAAAVGELAKRKAAAELSAPAAGERAKRKEPAAREQAKPKAKAKAGDQGVVPQPPPETRVPRRGRPSVARLAARTWGRARRGSLWGEFPSLAAAGAA